VLHIYIYIYIYDISSLRVNRGIFVTKTQSVSCRNWNFQHLFVLQMLWGPTNRNNKPTRLVSGTTSVNNSPKFP